MRNPRTTLGIRDRVVTPLAAAWIVALSTALVACGSPPGGGTPPPGGGPAPDPAPIEGLAFFWAATPAHGFEPWVTDGTDAGTRMIADLNPGPAGSIAQTHFVIHDGWAYFAANDGVHGDELWRTDGTEAGTSLVADLRPGPSGSMIEGFREVGGTLLFIASDDGTGTGYGTWTAGRDVDGVKRLTNSVHIAFYPESGKVEVGNAWYARGTQGLVQSAGSPTSETVPVTATHGVTPCGLNAITAFNGWVYYSGNDGVHGCELWRWGAMVTGNELFRDIAVLGTASGPSDFAVRGSRMYFRAAPEGCTTSAQCQMRQTYVTLGEPKPLDPEIEDTTHSTLITNPAGEGLIGNLRWHQAPWGDLFVAGQVSGYVGGWPLARVDGVSSIEGFTVIDGDPSIDYQTLRFFGNRLLYRSSAGYMSTNGGTPQALLPIGTGFVVMVVAETDTHLYLGVGEWHGSETRYTVWRTNGMSSAGTTRMGEVCRHDHDTGIGTCPEDVEVFPTWMADD